MKIEISKTESSHLLPAVRFVVSAAAKEETRYAINCVQINKNSLVATNGRRLHIAHMEHNWEPGLYEVVKKTKGKIVLIKSETEATFPQWQDIVPAHCNYFRSAYYGYGSDLWVDRNVGILARLGIGINSSNLVPLVEYGPRWNIYYGAFDQPLYAVSQGQDDTIKCCAVIMPVDMGFDKFQTHRRIVSNIYVQPETDSR